MLSRREFLATAAVAMSGPAVRAAEPAPETALVLAPEPGLFEATAGPEVVDQIELAATWGFRGFCDATLLQRPDGEARRLASAVNRLGLTPGPVLGPALGGNLRVWRRDLLDCLDRARTLGVTGLRIEVGPWAFGSTDKAHRETLRQLRGGANDAVDRGMTLLLDPWDDGRAGGPLFRRWRESGVMEELQSGLQLSLDTYRWAAAGIDRPFSLERVAHGIGHVELADFPGGAEAGTGVLPIAGYLRQLMAAGYRGVVGLRHGRSLPGRAGDEAVRRACLRLVETLARTPSMPVV